MHSVSAILINAPREDVFALVRELPRWQELLPHYRFVRVLGKDPAGWDLLHMSAEGGWFPVAWRAAYRSDPDSLELHFKHLAAFTRGMRVVWLLTPEGSGTRVEIVHELRFRVPGLGWLLEPVIQHGFIEPIARKTLSTFKSLLESRA